jgi:hypothetical protein
MMAFDAFIREIDAAVSAGGAGVVARSNSASWAAGEREVDIAVVPPQNVSVSLKSPGAKTDTTWYPIDPALVPVVSRRIAGFLHPPR